MISDYTTFEGHKLAYDVHGASNRAVLLIHGLLMNKGMQQPLARTLAEHGNRTISVDLAGHGKSDAPLQRWDIPRYAKALDTLLEELEVKEAVVLGTSLGANIALELAAYYPDRVRALVAEMPVLENGMVGGPIFFAPFAAVAAYAEPVAQVISKTAQLIPSSILPFSANIIGDLVKRDPATTLEILKGLYYGRVAPPVEDRRKITQPALVIGHRYDPIHPMIDAEDLAHDLRNSRLIEAGSIAELRTTPGRLTDEVVDFVDQCWRPRVVDLEDAPQKSGKNTS